MIDKDKSKLIGKVLSGEATPEEDNDLNAWLAASESNASIFNELRELWYETRLREYYSNKGRVFEKIMDGVNNPNHTPVFSEKKRLSISLKMAMTIAASVALVIVGLFWLKQYGQSISGDNMLQKSTVVIKSNPEGQKSKIFLPDGSQVWLNAESSLSYLSEFTDSIRTIELKGEAYFEVSKDTRRPFRVYCGGMTITALGTAFNVSVYHNEGSPMVALVEGRVMIQSSSDQIELNPGELCVLDQGRNKLNKSKTDLDNLVAWKDGVLIFKGENIHKTAQMLERWFGVDITISGNVDPDLKYYGKFKNEYLENILESMRFGRNFDYTIKGKNVHIQFN